MRETNPNAMSNTRPGAPHDAIEIAGEALELDRNDMNKDKFSTYSSLRDGLGSTYRIQDQAARYSIEFCGSNFFGRVKLPSLLAFRIPMFNTIGANRHFSLV